MAHKMILAALTVLALATTQAAPKVSWTLAHSHNTVETRHSGTPYTVQTDTYYSQAIPLKAGHMIYTEVEDTPLHMPDGTYAVTSFFGDIVDENHSPVPLSKVYDHHWIAVSDKHTNELCEGGLGNYVFGIGAESRNNPIDFPPGYGYIVEEGALWGANIHLLRTENLAGNPYKAAKECNECYYGPNKGAQCTPDKNGTFECCGEHDNHGVAFCNVQDGEQPPEESYYLRYNVTYTKEIDALTPLKVGVMSAPGCAAFYDVQRNDEDKVDHQSYSVRLPKDVHLALATGHMHTGALNVTMSINGELVCTSLPFYGTEEGAVGNEKGYLVRVSPCIDPASEGLDLKEGDEIRIDAHYYVGSDDDRLNYSDGTHLNVMAYMYVAYQDVAEGTNQTLSLPSAVVE